MRRRTLSYEDAVRVLGKESAVVRALGQLAGSGLTVASAGGSEVALSLFDLKGEAERLAQDAVSVVRERVSGLTRFERSELLEAAHAVVIVAAFFGALDDLNEEHRTALNSTTLDLTRAEQAGLAVGRSVRRGRLADLVEVLNTPGTLPDMYDRWVGTPLVAYYETLTERLLRFAPGTAAWDSTDETTRRRWTAALKADLPKLATTRYEKMLRQLAGDYPEVAFWAHQAGVRVLLDELRAARQDAADTGTMLAGLARMVRWMSQGRAPDELRSALATEYQAQVDRPLADSDAVPDGVRPPSCMDVYINPSYRRLTRLGRVAEQPEQVSEGGWQSAESGEDLETFLLQHLISPAATSAPLVVLGQPGTGKSLLTQMLAAQLPPDDYLVIRVELRNVPADADIQRQIEESLRTLTQVEHEWPTVAASCAPAQPVVLLDGFDELLQASTTVHFDYLEKVKDFQDREARRGRPAAVIVTSRSSVADQVRYPRESVVLRLEEFTDEQVRRWLRRWHAGNPARALSTEEALAHGVVARQPLLLFMLALFRADGGEVRGRMGSTELYESLFSRFAEREVDKRGRHLSERDRRVLVARELYVMSMVAFSMFNRSSQSVSEEDLARDLEMLPFADEARRRATAQEVAGRFFFKLFVHQSQAVEGHVMIRRYEFLHASFGEFLVGRWIADELARMVQRVLKNADDPLPMPPDDTRLRSIASFAVLADRARVTEVVADRLLTRPPEELVELRVLLIRLLRECMDSRAAELVSPTYEPIRLGLPARFAVYSANLCTLLVHTATALEGHDPSLARIPVSAIPDFFSITRSWYAHLTRKSWYAILEAIQVAEDSQELHISSYSVAWRPDAEPYRASEFLGYDTVRADPLILPGTRVARIFRETAMLESETQHALLQTLLPFLGAVGLELRPDFPIGLSGALAMELLTRRQGIDPVSRSQIYLGILASPPRLNVRFARLLLDALRSDSDRVQTLVVAHAGPAFERLAWANVPAFLDTIRTTRTSQFDVPPDWASHPDLAESVDVHNYRTLLGFHETPHSLDVRDLAHLLVLRDLMDLKDLDQVQALCRLVPNWEYSGHGLVRLAVWAAMAERDLVAHAPPFIELSRAQADGLDAIAPGYLAGFRELAAFWVDEDPVLIT
ncbi:NACHT domain-containing protein [Nonomuraea sp. NPDC050547]|uniref:NACHT domain-containing protein n=1 Tax=Nonomuraea sp. NPDC050547 TaxID=3364368 RepID=UPI0037B3A89E